MRTLYRLFIITLFSIAAPGFAGTYQTMTVKSSASGSSEDKAIVKALGQAIQQANGTQINIESHIRDTDQGIVMDWMGNQNIIPSQEVNVGYTSAKAGGLVKSYKVLSSQYLESAKVWKVTISAEVTKFANIGADRSGLLQVVILPFRTNDSTYATVDGSAPAEATAEYFNELMTNAMVQSGKFRVLDRSFWQESNIEELIVRERSYGTQESIKLGQKLGADYMVVGSIDDFDIERTVQAMYDSSTEVYETRFSIQLRVIEVATSDIIASSNFTQTLDKGLLNRELAQLRAANPQKSQAQLALDLQNYIYESVSNSLTQDIIGHITGTPNASATQQAVQRAVTPREARPLTPGSSEQPLQWK
jgi:curli biogenesis system outer membrane secretion channel CsgG